MVIQGKLYVNVVCIQKYGTLKGWLNCCFVRLIFCKVNVKQCQLDKTFVGLDGAYQDNGPYA